MNNIPGYITDEECRVLHELAASCNKVGSIIVELGSLHGKSSSIIAKAAPLAKVYCIDPWWGNDSSVPNINIEVAKKNGWPVPGTKNTIFTFLDNTQDCSNIVPVRANSPTGIEDLKLDVDMVFLDAAHTNPSDKVNIDFWLPQVKSGGIFAGHDYTDQWPDVKRNVTYLQTKLGKDVTNPPHTSIWYFYV
jgi:hypothetical protein